jgi:hypothetical protein
MKPAVLMESAKMNLIANGFFLGGPICDVLKAISVYSSIDPPTDDEMALIWELLPCQLASPDGGR